MANKEDITTIMIINESTQNEDGEWVTKETGRVLAVKDEKAKQEVLKMR